MSNEESKPTPDNVQQPAADGDRGIKRGLGALKHTIEDLSRSLREIQGPLSKTRETLPKATTHLDRISSQTEQATHKVLDMVENISTQQTEIISQLNNALNKLADSGGANKDVSQFLEKAEEVANRSLNDAFAIMDALQFQDITTQQINHAASLLEEVDDRIAEIFGELDGSFEDVDTEDLKATKARSKERSFDPHADMEFKHTDQSGIDSLVRENNGSRNS